jgi:hypothetical protein
MKWKTRLMSLDTIYLPNIEHELQKMASEGWMLNEVHNRSMIFQSCEPQTVKFNILINQSNEKEKSIRGPIGELEVLCIDDGWEFLLRFGRFVIFTSRNENIADIHTDLKIKINIVSKQIFRLLKYNLVWLFIFSGFVIIPIMLMKYKIVYSSLFVEIILLAILLLIDLSLMLFSNLIWWWKNRRISEGQIFGFQNTTYRIYSITVLVTWIMTFVAVLGRTILRPMPGTDLGILVFPLIPIAPFFLIFIWKRESENKLKIPKDLVGLIGLMFIFLIFEAFGGVTLFTGRIFSGNQALRTSDLTNVAIPYYPLDNLSEIGFFAMKTVDVTDFYSQDILHTTIIRFYSGSSEEFYWHSRIDDLPLSGIIDQEWELTGYYFNNKKGIIFRKDLEIIEIDGFVDMTNPSVISRIKTRLGFSNGN